jgi:DNA-binding LacI/PurR family transcriptional regulator
MKNQFKLETKPDSNAASPTIHELAKRLKVSVATVWRAINNKGRISATTRARVLAAIDTLGYRPSLVAQNLVNQRTGLLGVVVPMIGNTVYSPMVRAIEQEAFERGYNIILCDTGLDYDRERRYLDLLLRRRVEGVIMIPFAPRPTGGERHLLELEKAGVPLVLLEQDLPLPGIARVVADNRGGIRTAVRHLTGLGHHRIGFLYMPPVAWDFAARARLDGFRAAVTELGFAPEAAPELAIGDLLANEDAIDRQIAQLVTQLMARHDRPTAIVAPTDMLAIKTMRCLWLAGVRVPDELAIVGFDDILAAAHTTPSLTTMRQPTAAMGTRAAERLFARIRGDTVTAPEREVLPCELIVRESCGTGRPMSTLRPARFSEAARVSGGHPTTDQTKRRDVVPNLVA